MEQLRFDDLPSLVARLCEKIDRLEAVVSEKLTTPEGYEPDETFTIKQLAQYLNKSVSAVRVYKRDGKIPFHQVGKAIYFKKSEIDKALMAKNNKRKFFGR